MLRNRQFKNNSICLSVLFIGALILTAIPSSPSWARDPAFKFAIQKIKKKLIQADRFGYVYKTPYFWVQFYDGEKLEHIFNGEFWRGGLSPRYSENLGVAYLLAFSAQCPKHLPANARLMEITTTRVESVGGVITDRDESKRYMQVDPRYAEFLMSAYNKPDTSNYPDFPA